MISSRPLDGDGLVVHKLNQIFYDVEAEQYDRRHPEVLEGDADWWRSRGPRLALELKSELTAADGLMILDVGCGTGFVASVLSDSLAERDLIVGVDHSEGMLRCAGSKLSAAPPERCRFARADAADLPFQDRSFHMVTVNSFLHHVYDYRAVLRGIDRVLKPGGYLLLAHEPNKEFFRSPLLRWLGSAWKLIGFGMTVPEDLCARINSRLREARLGISHLEAADILRLVEYHSPVEQGPIRIDKSKGFALGDLLRHELSGYDLIESTEYSTFYRRPRLAANAWLMRLAQRAAAFLDGKGNLFSAVLRKAPA
jgi:ubiquinone/menaquinone biosynthesis C-methylase UbiE